jgi:hypothetical protein
VVTSTASHSLCSKPLSAACIRNHIVNHYIQRSFSFPCFNPILTRRGQPLFQIRLTVRSLANWSPPILSSTRRVISNAALNLVSLTVEYDCEAFGNNPSRAKKQQLLSATLLILEVLVRQIPPVFRTRIYAGMRMFVPAGNHSFRQAP